MNCPYCGKEMEKGYLQVARGVFFGKKKHKISFLPGQEDVKVAEDTGNGSFCKVISLWRLRNNYYTHG